MNENNRTLAKIILVAVETNFLASGVSHLLTLGIIRPVKSSYPSLLASLTLSSGYSSSSGGIGPVYWAGVGPYWAGVTVSFFAA